jgi:hypothetical protein
VSVRAGAGIRFGGYEATAGIESFAVDNVLVASRRWIARAPPATRPHLRERRPAERLDLVTAPDIRPAARR